MDPKHRRAYTGRSGQMAVMAELLDRGCNVAVPEIDVGRDVFAFQDDEEEASHIQVKTAGKARALKAEGHYTAQIDVPLDQLKRPDVPALYYVFAIRLAKRWADFLVIRRRQLRALCLGTNLGTKYIDPKTRKAHLKHTFSFRKDDVTCSGESFQAYRNAWTSLPPLRPAGSTGEAADVAPSQAPETG